MKLNRRRTKNQNVHSTIDLIVGQTKLIIEGPSLPLCLWKFEFDQMTSWFFGNF